jgi:uncharacterized membrane protein
MRRHKRTGFKILAMMLLLSLSSCRHDADISDLPKLYYDTDVKSIINSNCVMCHSEYSTYEGLMSIVKTGKPQKSELYQVITNPWAMLRMPEPPSAPLTTAQRSTINLWILQGAHQSHAQ